MINIFNFFHKRQKKGDDTMSAVATNYVYEIKVSPDSSKKKTENVLTAEMLAALKKEADKYPYKK